jgi:hypothetical protein
MSMRDFSQKYGADTHVALRALRTDNLGTAEGAPGEIDKLTRKRKWVASIDLEQEVTESKAVKNGRSISFLCFRWTDAATARSPSKKPGSSTGPGTAQRSRPQISANHTSGNVSKCLLVRIPD